MNILLHICCGICACGMVEQLREDGHSIVGHFYNPNIHPFIEFRRRLKAVKVFQSQGKLPIHYDEQYGLYEFLDSVDYTATTTAARCSDCYRMRLERTAQKTKELSRDAFTTTLLTSPHQDIGRIMDIGNDIAARYGITFIGGDYRHLHELNREKAKRMMLYHQQYCGCIFSEYERFKDTTKHIYRG